MYLQHNLFFHIKELVFTDSVKALTRVKIDLIVPVLSAAVLQPATSPPSSTQMQLLSSLGIKRSAPPFQLHPLLETSVLLYLT